MKRTVPFFVRIVSLLAAAGITSLIIGVHAVDLTTLGALDPVARGGRATVVASLGGVERPVPTVHLSID